MKPNSAYIFFSNTFPHLLQTNFVFPFFPLTPAAAPATTAPTGPKSTPPTISPAMAFPRENFFFVSTGIPIPLQPNLGHLTLLAILLTSLQYSSFTLINSLLQYELTVFHFLPLLFRNKNSSWLRTLEWANNALLFHFIHNP